MNGDKVADIALGEIDQTGKRVEFIFSKVAEIFAIYSNGDRVVVHYADEPDLALDQRRIVAFLAPVRGEITGLTDDWREGRSRALKDKARQYDRRTADALVVALQGDGETAKALLQAVRNDILEERSSLGRLYYVAMAVAAGLVVSLLSWLSAWLLSLAAAEGTTAAGHYDLALTSSFGCLGALFSIALAIRDRAVQIDRRLRDNLLDAGLRMLIGAVSAYLLLVFFRSGIVVLSLGSLGEIGKPTAGSPVFGEVAIIITFLAGFSERLVGNLLNENIIPGLVKGDTSVDAASRTAPKPAADAAIGSAPKTERNPLGRDLPPVPSAEAEVDEAVDGCLCDHEVDELDTTEDVELPAASGGVDRLAG